MAYSGKLLVGHGGGRWAFGSTESAAVVEMPNGPRACAHNKVAKRLDHGPEHNLFQFYCCGLTKQTPPATNVSVLSGHPAGGRPLSNSDAMA